MGGTTVPPPRLLIKKYHSTEELSKVLQPPSNLQKTKIFPTEAPPRISYTEVPPKVLPSTKSSPNTPPPQILSSTTPSPIISPPTSTSSPPPSRKTENRVEENSSLSFKGIPGLLFTTRMKDIIMGVHKTLSRQPSHTITGKLKYLEQIKNHLLNNIWDRSRILWRGSSSVKRRSVNSWSMSSYFPTGGGEGPLITIALLTFAVFLIKIVQQFIQGLQASAAAANPMQQMPAAQGGGRGGRVKRWSDDRFQEATRMLHYMERYKFHSEL